MLNSFRECIFGRPAKRPPLPKNYRSTESIASEIITMILKAESPYTVKKEVDEVFSINTWTDAIVNSILNGLKHAIESGAEMAQASADALVQAKNNAVQFAVDNPGYTTLLALGILALLTPWALEVFGFGELGPTAGSLAAIWQRTYYGGDVPKRALFGYFQRLGMKNWHWTFQ